MQLWWLPIQSKNTSILNTNRPVLIAGPTASGKSSFAYKMAASCNGLIINTDSMQVYDGLPIITAQPSQPETVRQPHVLYGHVDPKTSYSVGNWIEDVKRVLSLSEFKGMTPIFVGGTGLYFRALLEGLSPIPDIPADIRAYWRSFAQSNDTNALYNRLKDLDPRAAKQMDSSNPHRLIRALEVIDGTNRSLLDWQQESSSPLYQETGCKKYLFDPPRDQLNDRIVQRVQSMLTEGVIDEIRTFLDQNLAPDCTSMRAIGVRQFGSYLRNEMSLEDAIDKIAIATRQYAKRQRTWFRNQIKGEWNRALP